MICLDEKYRNLLPIGAKGSEERAAFVAENTRVVNEFYEDLAKKYLPGISKDISDELWKMITGAEPEDMLEIETAYHRISWLIRQADRQARETAKLEAERQINQLDEAYKLREQGIIENA